MNLHRHASGFNLGRPHLRQRAGFDALGDGKALLAILGDGVEHLHQRHDPGWIGGDGFLGSLDRTGHGDRERIRALVGSAKDRAIP
ncbi:MAG: hypothetical protein BWX86_00952 [Verrucomicrobia bacterium ADurb.Bin122]|nr:MAG: hypothetical protein BWX86_00952 [Verrucomicrobia bacterium ADurb.Bin122]